jgi:hypothetical protein
VATGAGRVVQPVALADPYLTDADPDTSHADTGRPETGADPHAEIKSRRSGDEDTHEDDAKESKGGDARQHHPDAAPVYVSHSNPSPC